ncbi:hypothetical protein BVRB_2g031580 [Beta vulgaris subsp. vulgaris]|uniref:Uncharacterized protein n=1 Tax=Beta vulgaris subsp. vulgaris TaxID=3555 RepID=A0A0J8D1E8_BETVV|nr:hypothetical protein BVRB_2g031580 [Beta vulgaris subsp. vulgaris]
MDWKLVVRTQDNVHPSGHRMETNAQEYLEAKKAATLQRSATGSTPYLRDPPLRLPSKTERRSLGPSVVRPRQEKTVLQPMVYKRLGLANTSSNPVLKEFRREHIPTEGQPGALQITCRTPFSSRIMEAPPFPKVKLPMIVPVDGTTDPDDHLSAYKHQMYVQAVDDATWSPAAEEMTTVGTWPSFSIIKGPYLLASSVKEICGLLPRHKRFPKMGNG